MSLVFICIAISSRGQDSIRLSGQLSGWMNLSSGNDIPVTGGLRYIPQLNWLKDLVSKRQIDFEISANIYGTGGFSPPDSLTGSGNIKAYRTWIRYTSSQFELRLGLQKINFGSALMLRPLMWFDRIDPRDPLQLTDGVWGLLARYYFLNNTNVWLWGLYGNSGTKGWEQIPVNKKIPEFGGRLQFPLPSGEIAFSYHHRIADSRNMGSQVDPYEEIPENRIGFDAKWDMKAGLWFEGSLSHKGKEIGNLTNQVLMNAGIDYTFKVGSGLYVAAEQLLVTSDVKAFTFTNNATYSLLTLNYPVGLFDRLSTILYYGWSSGQVYSFLTWQRQFDKFMFYTMAYWNPDQVLIPSESGSQNVFAGKGIQFMVVFNH
jgi:hypothetical protein